jgi:transcriptional regulator with XRE-family HTH domain
MDTGTSFSENLRLVLKMLSMSSAQLASMMETDKSVVSRWLKGSVQPSAHNLSRLSALIATLAPGFKELDWERDPQGLAELFGADAAAIPALRAVRPAKGLPLDIWDQMIATAAIRGQAYEGFFRSTRPHPVMPHRYLHLYGMIRRDDTGLLRMRLGSAEHILSGWLIPLHNQLYSICTDPISGALAFAIFNGVDAKRVDVFDGLTLIAGLALGCSSMASAMICERIGDLSGDREADDRRCAELASRSPLAPEGSIPEAIQKHLAWDVGPEAAARGGDWMLAMSLSQSMTRGSDA